MATEIEIDTIINTDRSEQGLSKLRSGLKELISLQGQVGANSDQFKKLQKAINDTEGKIGDLTDSFQTLKGSGVERLNNSIGLLREGFTAADPGKFKIALEGVGAAMKAIPIFLLIEGAKYLYENMNKLLDVFKKLNPEMREQAEITRLLSERTNELGASIAGVRSEYDTQIKLSQAAGFDQLEILNLQVKKFNELQILYTKQAAAFKDLYMQGGEESAKFYDESLKFEQKAKDATIDGAATLLAIDKLKADRKEQARKDHLEKLKQIEAEKLAEQKAYDDRIAYIIAQEAKERERQEAQKLLDNQKRNESRAKEQEQMLTYLEEDALFNQAFREGEARQDEEAAKNKIDLAKRVTEAEKQQQAIKQQSQDAFLNAGLALSTAYFQTQLNQAKGNAAAEIKIREKQFKVDKAFAISRAIIDGVRSVQAALTLPPPASYILAAANGVLAAANIAKIASTKFSPGSSASDTTAITAPTIGGGGGNFNTQQTPTANSSAFNPTGLSNVQGDKKKESQRVYVLESDIRNATNRVNVIESRATFG